MYLTAEPKMSLS